MKIQTLRNQKAYFWIAMFLFLATLAVRGVRAEAAEDFKGTTPYHVLDLGMMGGLGTFGHDAGFATIGTVALRILEHGFIPDEINDQVFVELQLGPEFMGGETAWFTSAHLRWDFPKDDDWTFYALGGVAGNITNSTGGRNRVTVLPRVGVGAMWVFDPRIGLRAEVSHELLGAGLSIRF